MNSVDDELDTWPAFVDVFAGALMFLLLGFMALAAGHIRAEWERLNSQRIREMEAQTSTRSRGGEILKDLVGALKDDDVARCELISSEVVCAFKGKLKFPRNEWNLADEAMREKLVGFGRTIQPYIRNNKVAAIEVEGHTDPDPTRGDMTNWELSSARAGHVVRLLQKGGVPGGCLTAIGYAEFNNADTGASYADRRLVKIRVKVLAAGDQAGARCRMES